MLAAMSRASDPPATPAVESGEAIARRKLLKQAGWVVPAIVTTVPSLDDSFPLVLPIGRPFVDVDEDHEFDPEFA